MSVVSALDLTFPRNVPLRPSRSRHSSAGPWEMLQALRCPEWRDPISGAHPKFGFLVPGVCRSTALCLILAGTSEPSPRGVQQRGGHLHLEYGDQSGEESPRGGEECACSVGAGALLWSGSLQLRKYNFWVGFLERWS